MMRTARWSTKRTLSRAASFFFAFAVRRRFHLTRGSGSLKSLARRPLSPRIFFVSASPTDISI